VIGVAVWETPNIQGIFEQKMKIVEKLKKIKKQRKINLIYFGTLDIFKKDCNLVIIEKEEKRVAEKAFGKKEKDYIIYLPGVISRKKQIIPKFAKILGK
jgi:manganese-dependent inorganic pyrophosphatase